MEQPHIMVLAALGAVLDALDNFGRKLYDMLQMTVMRVIHDILQWVQFFMNMFEGQTLTRIKYVLNSMHAETLALAITVGLGCVLMLSLLRHMAFFLPSRKGLRLPPGSMGWPFIGETYLLRSQQQKFYLARQKKYGELFRTHLFGYPSIATTSPEAAKFVLVEHPNLFRQRGLPVVEDMLGSRFFGYADNHTIHLKLRKQLQGPMLHLHNLIPQLEAWALCLMRSWEGRTVNALQEARLYAFNVATMFILGPQPEQDRKELTKACEYIVKGLGSWRINLPGTNYYNACQGRKKACAIVDKIVSRRRSSRSKQHTDILGVLMDAEDEDKIPMSSRELQENILTLLFAAHNTSAAALTWALKNLRENGRLLDELTEEHDKIVQRKTAPDEALTWTDIKDMPITQRVIKETLRVANLVDFSYREALQDIAYRGNICCVPSDN